MKKIDIGNYINTLIKERVDFYCSQKKELNLLSFCATDSFAEIVEKLIILHIRTWMLEDQIGTTSEDKQIADLKRKIDICFKQKRPKLIESLNKIIDDSIINQKSLREDSVKIYKGISENE